MQHKAPKSMIVYNDITAKHMACCGAGEDVDIIKTQLNGYAVKRLGLWFVEYIFK